MSLKSKRTIVSLAAGIASLFAYLMYALSSSAPNGEDLKSWAIVILVAIGIAVGIQIITHIVFHIAAAVSISVKEPNTDQKMVERIIESEMSDDERDTRITLKSSHIGYSCVGVGFIAALIALACGVLVVTALHILAGAYFTASLADGIASVVLYEKGVRG